MNDSRRRWTAAGSTIRRAYLHCYRALWRTNSDRFAFATLRLIPFLVPFRASAASTATARPSLQRRRVSCCWHRGWSAACITRQPADGSHQQRREVGGRDRQYSQCLPTRGVRRPSFGSHSPRDRRRRRNGAKCDRRRTNTGKRGRVVEVADREQNRFKDRRLSTNGCRFFFKLPSCIRRCAKRDRQRKVELWQRRRVPTAVRRAVSHVGHMIGGRQSSRLTDLFINNGLADDRN